jgi:heterodisulfide reductase subunit A2
MKTAVYFCRCGNNITERIDEEQFARKLAGTDQLAYIAPVDFACSEDGKQFLEKDLLEKKPDRVVIAACSPREYEEAFQQVLGKAGLNPYFLQMVNIREHVAWVTPDKEQATEKAATMVRGAIARVGLHQPLEVREIEASPNVLIIGGGPAGLKATLTLAEAGRKVILLEKAPVLGGMPVRYEELFPNLECGPCMLEPVLGDILHGKHSGNIEILTLSELVDVSGYFGNFTVKLKRSPRYVDEAKCIGCGLCIPPCPVNTSNEFNCGMNQRHAIALPFPGALPNVPFLDHSACSRSKGEDCHLCKDACPVEGTILFDEREKLLERQVGAIVVAIGSKLYDCGKLPGISYGQLQDVYTSVEFERLMASNGPTGGAIVTRASAVPESVAIVHCVGSLDKKHKPYCSGICCEYAFKFNHILEKKVPAAKVHHFYKEMVMPGKEEFALHQHIAANPNTTLTRYAEIDDLKVTAKNGKKTLQYTDVAGKRGTVAVDMVVLCPAVVPVADAEGVGELLEVTRDKFGFMEELHGRLHTAQSKIKGIYLAGSCQAPMDIQKAVSQGTAAAGYVLSELVEGRKLRVEPITASVNENRCSACKVCATVCPYKAIAHPPERGTAEINALLCHGCGTCVAACPAGAITGNHFTNEQILAELEAVLQ